MWRAHSVIRDFCVDGQAAVRSLVPDGLCDRQTALQGYGLVLPEPLVLSDLQVSRTRHIVAKTLAFFRRWQVKMVH